MPFKMTKDFGLQEQIIINANREMTKEVVRYLLPKTMNTIGVTISSRFMVKSGRAGSKTLTALKRNVESQRTHPSKLTIRSGRLVKSLLDQFWQGLKEGIRRLRKINDGKVSAEYGTAVPYAEVHERGLTVTQRISAHNRTITQAYGKSIEPKTIRVREHSRTTKFKKRPFLKPAIKFLFGGNERTPNPVIIRPYIQKAVDILTKLSKQKKR